MHDLQPLIWLMKVLFSIMTLLSKTMQSLNQVKNSLIPGCTRIYFVDALGVTGKTFVFNHIINTAVAGGCKVKCAVWIRFAATL